MYSLVRPHITMTTAIYTNRAKKTHNGFQKNLNSNNRMPPSVQIQKISKAFGKKHTKGRTRLICPNSSEQKYLHKSIDITSR